MSLDQWTLAVLVVAAIQLKIWNLHVSGLARHKSRLQPLGCGYSYGSLYGQHCPARGHHRPTQTPRRRRISTLLDVIVSIWIGTL